MFTKMQKPVIHAMLTCLACLACGCASVDFLKFGKEDFPTADAKNPVVQVIGMWQPTHGVDTDGKSCRGFAGQILFLTRDNPVPAKVDGTVRIYVFDDQGKPEDQVKPIHQFDFPGDSWNVQARISKLGLTYALFIPYTRPGAHEAHCSLKVRFIPKEGPGRPVFSEMCNVELPGINNKKLEKETAEVDVDDEYVRKAVKAAKETSRGRVELASYEETAGSPNSRQAIEQIAAEAFRDANAKASTTSRKLPPEEEQRIIREMQAQMGGKLASSEEPRVPKAKPNRPRGRNPLNDAPPALDDDDDDDRPVYTRSANRPVSRKSHMLAEDSDVESEPAVPADDEIQPVSKKDGRSKTATPARHPLERDDAPETARRNRRWGEALTINLSEVR